MALMNVLIFSRLLLGCELAAQIVVVATESVSNSQYRMFPPSAEMMGYSGQSLLVIIVSILIILMTLLVLRNLGRILVQTSWKISISCIGFSLASIAFRTFSAWFTVSSTSQYYLASYNITSYFIIIGAVIWVPFIFCKSDKYRPPVTDAERHRITTTGGPRPVMTHRPHQDEDNRSTISGAREELPSYYEMIPPPAYKNTPTPNPNANDDSSPSTNVNMTEANTTTTTDANIGDDNASPPLPNSGAGRSPPPSIHGYTYEDATVINIDNNATNPLPSTADIANNENNSSPRVPVENNTHNDGNSNTAPLIASSNAVSPPTA